MKTTLTIFILSFFLFALNAQEENDVNPQQRFVGVWQQCILNNDVIKADTINKRINIDTINIKQKNFYKYFGKGGDFNAFSINPALSYIEITGTYEVYHDKYIENVGYHSNPNFANKRVELPYMFYGNNYIMLTYRLDNGYSSLEVWKRLPSYETVKQEYFNGN